MIAVIKVVKFCLFSRQIIIKLRFDEVWDACNTKWNIKILEARDGIGGHCLPKDTRYPASLTAFNALIKSAMVVDKMYRAWRARKIQKSA